MMCCFGRHIFNNFLRPKKKSVLRQDFKLSCSSRPHTSIVRAQLAALILWVGDDTIQPGLWDNWRAPKENFVPSNVYIRIDHSGARMSKKNRRKKVLFFKDSIEGKNLTFKGKNLTYKGKNLHI
jgi:hypothetical protein